MNQADQDAHWSAVSPAGMWALSAAVGILSGLGMVAFRYVAGLFHNLFFYGQLSIQWDSLSYGLPSIWGAAVVLVPVAGAFGVAWLSRPPAETGANVKAGASGVADVMDAIYHRNGHIAPAGAVRRALAAALSGGTGASVGREGPVIQIGAAFGAIIGRWMRIAPWQRITLVAAGAGAGLAATFDAPLGAVLFAIELMLPEVSVRTFLPVAIATGSATFVSRLFFGADPEFMTYAAPNFVFHARSVPELIPYILLGACAGIAGGGLIRGLAKMESLFGRIANRYLRHALGMALVGGLMLVMITRYGHYFVEGAGYATIRELASGHFHAVDFLMLLFLAKLATTLLSHGSGAAGGTFSATLYLGAAFGAAVGSILHMVLPGTEATVSDFAIVGMSAFLGATTGAALTAIVMAFELTHNYGIIVPIILSTALAISIRRLLLEETIYTLKLVRRGHRVPNAMQANMPMVRQVRDTMMTDLPTVQVTATIADGLQAVAPALAAGARALLLVAAGNRIIGYVRFEPGTQALADGAEGRKPLNVLVRRDFVLCLADDIMFDVAARLARHEVEVALVVPERRTPRVGAVLGYISTEEIGRAVIADVHAASATHSVSRPLGTRPAPRPAILAGAAAALIDATPDRVAPVASSLSQHKIA